MEDQKTEVHHLFNKTLYYSCPNLNKFLVVVVLPFPNSNNMRRPVLWS